MRHCQRLAVALALAAIAATPGAAQKADHQQLFDAKHFLEDNPFDKDAVALRGWALQWINKTKDVTVLLCEVSTVFVDDKKKVGPELLAQYMIGMATFKLQNKGAEEQTAQLAGLDSALNAYRVMVEQKPEVKDPAFDALQQKRADGDLAKLVDDPKCKMPDKKARPGKKT